MSPISGKQTIYVSGHICLCFLSSLLCFIIIMMIKIFHIIGTKVLELK